MPKLEPDFLEKPFEGEAFCVAEHPNSMEIADGSQWIFVSKNQARWLAARLLAFAGDDEAPSAQGVNGKRGGA